MISAACIIDKISSNKEGGYCIKLEISQQHTEAVKALLDTINNTVFQVSFDKISDLEVEKRSPGRPRKDQE